MYTLPVVTEMMDHWHHSWFCLSHWYAAKPCIKGAYRLTNSGGGDANECMFTANSQLPAHNELRIRKMAEGLNNAGFSSTEPQP